MARAPARGAACSAGRGLASRSSSSSSSSTSAMSSMKAEARRRLRPPRASSSSCDTRAASSGTAADSAWPHRMLAQTPQPPESMKEAVGAAHLLCRIVNEAAPLLLLALALALHVCLLRLFVLAVPADILLFLRSLLQTKQDARRVAGFTSAAAAGRWGLQRRDAGQRPNFWTAWDGLDVHGCQDSPAGKVFDRQARPCCEPQRTSESWYSSSSSLPASNSSSSSDAGGIALHPSRHGLACHQSSRVIDVRQLGHALPQMQLPSAPLYLLYDCAAHPFATSRRASAPSRPRQPQMTDAAGHSSSCAWLS